LRVFPFRLADISAGMRMIFISDEISAEHPPRRLSFGKIAYISAYDVKV